VVAVGARTAKRIDNLPADVSRLVGRRAESVAVKQLLAQGRLVTLAGTGGVGKTRLAVHIARQVRHAFPDGACLVMLAELATAELLPTTVMSALSMSGSASADLSELCRFIGDRELLLVLDNCEHLTEPCAQLVTALLRECPRLRILATSRERLRVEGESVYVVPPLRLPEPGQTVAPDEIQQYDAAALFIDRATAIRPELVPSPKDLENILTLCHRLDGLPLAIELMAGRVGSLPIKALADRHEDRFRILTTGSRSSPPRQQTLQATVAYSFELCSDAARLLWARMSVFARGATLEGVLGVCTEEAFPQATVEDALAELVDKSIVTFDGARYQMLETLRAYGRDRLRDAGSEGTVRAAHLRHVESICGGVGRESAPDLSRAYLVRLREEHANIRAALEFCLADEGPACDGLRLAGSLWHFWVGCGLAREGRHWLGELLRVCDDPSLDRVTGLWVDGCLAAMDGDPATAREQADACADLARNLGDRAGIAHATWVHGLASLIEQPVDDELIEVETAVRLERDLDQPNPVLGAALLTLGMACCLLLRLSRAETLLAEARDIGKSNSQYMSYSWSLVGLGLVAVLKGDMEAASVLKEVLRENRATGDPGGVSSTTEFLAWAAMDAGDDLRAARLLGFSQGIAEPVIAHLFGWQILESWHNDRLAVLRDRLGDEVLQAELSRGRAMPVADGIAYALEERSAPPPAAPEQEKLPLTRREHEVAQLLARGLSNRDIASQLVISPRTVEGHVDHILTKLGFTSRAQVIALFAARASHQRGEKDG
jgi:predicted ATPase/DNA-binding CsgD family transcriptional regulator